MAGAWLGARQAGHDAPVARSMVLDVAVDLEGHADNVAASLDGSLAVVAAGNHLTVSVPDGLAVVVWSPDQETSTDAARADLPATVPLDDAVANIGGTAMIVAAFSSGDASGFAELRSVFSDRIHQEARLSGAPLSREVLDRFGETSAIGSWLSGSGPTVAALAEEHDTDEVEAAVDTPGHCRTVEIDRVGLVESP